MRERSHAAISIGNIIIKACQGMLKDPSFLCVPSLFQSLPSAGGFFHAFMGWCIKEMGNLALPWRNSNLTADRRKHDQPLNIRWTKQSIDL